MNKEILREAFNRCIQLVWCNKDFPDDTQLFVIREKLDNEFGKEVMKEMNRQAESGELWKDEKEN